MLFLPFLTAAGGPAPSKPGCPFTSLSPWTCSSPHLTSRVAVSPGYIPNGHSHAVHLPVPAVPRVASLAPHYVSPHSLHLNPRSLLQSWWLWVVVCCFLCLPGALGRREALSSSNQRNLASGATPGPPVPRLAASTPLGCRAQPSTMWLSGGTELSHTRGHDRLHQGEELVTYKSHSTLTAP